MSKSADAFRTISEVADWLGVQPHVLRFWESKFTQVKPVKRAGGRRYYRPNDMLLLGGIRKLLHEEGLTIKGVQKLMREEGMAYVADMSPPLDEQLAQVSFDSPAEPMPEPAPSESAQPDMFSIVSSTPSEPEANTARTAEPTASEPVQPLPVNDPAPSKPLSQEISADDRQEDADLVNHATFEADEVEEAPMAEDVPQEDAEITHLPSFVRADAKVMPAEPLEDLPAEKTDLSAQGRLDTDAHPESTLPSFSHSPVEPTEPEIEAVTAPAPISEPAAAAKPAQPVPAIIDAPDPDESTFHTEPSVLSAAFHLRTLSAEQRNSIAPLAARLAAHRDQLASNRAATGAV